MHRVAVIGSGIAGLGAAWRLSRPQAGQPPLQVTLFEAGRHFGGHAHTVDLALDGVHQGVDTGFLVYNQRTYPLLTQLFAELGVEVAASDMSFSVQVPRPDGRPGLEWSGSSLSSVFAQRSNLLRPRFWHMLAEILRFNREAPTLLQAAGDERQRVGQARQDAELPRHVVGAGGQLSHRRAAQHRADARDQLAGAERLRDVIVRAHAVRRSAFLLIVMPGHHDDP